MYKKNNTSKSVSVLVLTLSFCLFFALSCQAAQLLTVAKDGINVRKGPKTEEPVVMELFEGWPLKVVSQQGDWYEIVDYEGDKGWVHSSLVRPNDTIIVNVKKSGNMRSAPDSKAAVVAEVERGVVLIKGEKKGPWIKVKHSQGTEGWIHDSIVWPN